MFISNVMGKIVTDKNAEREKLRRLKTLIRESNAQKPAHREKYREEITELVLNSNSEHRQRLAILFLRDKEILEKLVMKARREELNTRAYFTLYETEEGKRVRSFFPTLQPEKSINVMPKHSSKPGNGISYGKYMKLPNKGREYVFKRNRRFDSKL